MHTKTLEQVGPLITQLMCTLALGMSLVLPCRGSDHHRDTVDAFPAGVDVAPAQGYFAAEGVGVRVTDCSSGPRCMRQRCDGSAQLVTVSELPVVSSSFERADYAPVATIVTSIGNIQLIGRNSAGVTTSKQLAGKRIGVVVGSSSHFYVDAYVHFHAIDPRQVEAFSGYSRHTGLALKSLGVEAVVLDDSRIYSESHYLVVNQRSLAKRDGDRVKVLRALQRAERLIAKYPLQANAKAKAIMQARANLDRAFVDSIFPSFNYRLSLEQSLVNSMEGVARWSLREGHVAPGRRIPNYRDFVEPGPLRTAVPRAFPT